ncbi:MAG: vitamin B12-dependent ribonucleotide reductase [Elusimicrobia bacterium]|nr:vitamin B12-dependent ribonucleotide reductase [Elusimicrobiota bacterium]
MPRTISKAQNPKKAGSLQLSRYFTSSKEDPLGAVAYERRVSSITDADGSSVFEMKDVEVPQAWSQLATDILASKYCRPTSPDASSRENSAKQAVGRVVRAIRGAAGEQGVLGGPAAKILEDELAHLLIRQMAAFNTPVWLNAGLAREYGVRGQGGNWFWNPETGKVEMARDAYTRPQCSACFIQSAEDSLPAIFDLLKSEARIFKYGSGSGSNFSKIRSRYEKLSTGGSPSGLMFFLEVFDKGAGAIKSGGISRRAAKMVCLDMDHPEIVDFLQWKQREEKKVAVMVAAGYPSDFNGEAYRTVSGQNSNNSVRVSDAFMRAVLEDGAWETALRTTGRVFEKHEARKLMKLVAQAAWSCADPGVQFDSTINRYHTCPAADRIRASNPCSEYMFLDDTACNLASLNLLKFLREDNVFDVEAFRRAARVVFLAQEILVDYSSYPTERIAKNSHDYRPLGLGYANLGTLLMILGLPYDSPEARSWCGALTAILTAEAYKTSAEIAAARGGPFAGFEENREPMLAVMRIHQAAVRRIEPGCPEYLLRAAGQSWAQAVRLGERHGYRNAQATVLAPTGTIGLLMDCDTTGIEPDFALVKFKKLAGGGTIKIVNHSVERALKNLGYAERERKSIIAHVLETGGVENAQYLKPEHLPVFDCAAPCGGGTRFIAPMGHVRMMAAAQPFISGAISKTVNLPHQSTVQDIESIFIESWKLGLKAISVYRDGCKLSQPLSVAQGKGAESEVKMAGAILERRYLPQKRAGHTYEAAIAGQKIYVKTGEYPDGRLGEVFIDFNKPGSPLQEMLNCLGIAVSLGLQYGVPLEDLVNRLTFTRFEPAGPVKHPHIKQATSVIDFIFRLLGVEYLGRSELAHVPPDRECPAKPKEDSQASGAADAPFCDGCGHVTVRNGTCYKCLNCGNSLGCS